MDKKKLTAEQEHKKDIEETTDLITAEDLVEQAVYAATLPTAAPRKNKRKICLKCSAQILWMRKSITTRKNASQ